LTNITENPESNHFIFSIDSQPIFTNFRYMRDVLFERVIKDKTNAGNMSEVAITGKLTI
jgi:hypothetical protein